MRMTLLLACALSLASCAGSRSASSPNVYDNSELVYTSTQRVHGLDTSAQRPAYLVPAPAGSSARQRRQWQRAQAANLARAGISPKKVKIRNSTLATAPGAVATTITKPTGPVATGAGSATDNSKAGQKGGSAATAPNAVAATTTKRGLSYWWLLLVAAMVAYWQRKRLALLFA